MISPAPKPRPTIQAKVSRNPKISKILWGPRGKFETYKVMPPMTQSPIQGARYRRILVRFGISRHYAQRRARGEAADGDEGHEPMAGEGG